MLIGTTGLDESADERIVAAARQIAVLRAPNTSLGVALLAELVERAAQVLGPEWDIEIAEMHHRMKADAPSGTALLLGEAAARGRGTALEAGARPRRHRHSSARRGAIGFASLRGGTVAGEHDVMFLGPTSGWSSSHRAENRMIFARGALAGARFLVGKPAGLYSMRDVIGPRRLSAARGAEASRARPPPWPCSTRPCWSWAGSSARASSSLPPRSRATSARHC